MFAKIRRNKPGRISYIMPQETKDKISKSVKQVRAKNPKKESNVAPGTKMKLFDYIQRNKGTAYKKGSHRNLNYTVTGKQAPTTHQAATSEWVVK